jgi:hypothetical protein
VTFGEIEDFVTAICADMNSPAEEREKLTFEVTHLHPLPCKVFNSSSELFCMITKIGSAKDVYAQEDDGGQENSACIGTSASLCGHCCDVGRRRERGSQQGATPVCFYVLPVWGIGVNVGKDATNFSMPFPLRLVRTYVQGNIAKL